MKKIFYLMFFSGITVAACGQEKELQTILSKDSITGMQVAYSKGKQTSVYNLGISGKDPIKKVTSSTVFQAASLSKVVVAYTALRLYDRGLFSLDTPLSHYFSYDRVVPDSNFDRITARMVLTHTSGLLNWQINHSSPGWAASKLTLLFKPGTAWSYSGEGFVYLQRMLEHLTGKTLDKLVSEEVFVPLNMKNSSFIWLPGLEPLMAYGHVNNANESQRTKALDALAPSSMITTASDYTLFLQALLKGQGLKHSTLEMMFTKAATPDRFKRPKKEAADHLGWGLGVGIQNNEKGKAIWHWGDNGDFKCFFIAYPATGESLVYMTNDEHGLNALEDILPLFFGKQDFWVVKWL